MGTRGGGAFYSNITSLGLRQQRNFAPPRNSRSTVQPWAYFDALEHGPYRTVEKAIQQAVTGIVPASTMAAVEADGSDVDEAISPRQPTSIAHDVHFGAISDKIESLDLRVDPDAQTTVTDYLDFTEYLPADIMRSLTLIGKLDQTYIDASTRVHNLTSTWGELPSLPPEVRPAPVRLRADISESLDVVVNSRIYSHAEATRMAETVNRHYNRAKTILAKLTTMKENYPPPEEQKSPVMAKSPQLSRTKVNLRAEGGALKPRRPRVPRITVPGEVLAPYELNYDEYSDDSDESSDDDDAVSLPRATPGAQPRIKLVKTAKPPKVRTSKPVKTSSGSGGPPHGFPPAVPLSQLKPPPENAVPGSADAPWLMLTGYEMAKLRKRMKKNAQWTPSETMIARELSVLGRGADAYKLAKQQADDEGRPFDSSLPVPVYDAEGVAHPPFGALSLDTALTAEERQKNNRGMKLNEAKKLKKENNLSKLAAQEAEESTRQFLETARALISGFNPVDQGQAAASRAPPQLQPQPKKRKREALPEADGDKGDSQETPSQKSHSKRTKTETPVPVPPAHETPVHPPQLSANNSAALLRRATPVPIPVPGQDQSMVAAPLSGSSASPPLNGSGSCTTVTTTVPLKMSSETPVLPPLTSPQKSTTPIFPPTRETRAREAARKEQHQDPSQPVRSASRAATPGASSAAGDVAAQKRPPSRRGMSQEPQQASLAADRSRRASTARNTPAPESAAQQQQQQQQQLLQQQQQQQQQRQAGSKRPKRPAPGVVSRTSSGGSSAVTRRKAPPKKKRGQQQAQQAQQQKRDSKDSAAIREEAGEVDVDDEGNDIDPEEPRYCLCNRVSFGTMIQCDNIDVSLSPRRPLGCKMTPFLGSLTGTDCGRGRTASKSGSTSSASA